MYYEVFLWGGRHEEDIFYVGQSCNIRSCIFAYVDVNDRI